MSGLYELLGLDSGASPDQIRAAITAQRRIWRRRATSPDIAVRQEAERRMQQLDEAERNLTDPVRRAQYNAELEAGAELGTGATVKPRPAQPEAATESGEPAGAEGNASGSVARAVEQISRNQHGVAAFTARKAVSEDPENPYAWSVLAQATSAAGDHVAAVEAIERALHLDPEDARLHAQRGAVLRAAGEPDRALAAYQAAVSLDDSEPEYRVGVIEQLIVSGAVDQAITEAQEGYRARPEEGALRNVLAQALAERARLAQHELADGALVITTEEQAKFVESLSSRGLSVHPTDPEVRSDLERHRDYARKARRKAFSPSAIKTNYKWPLGVGLIMVAALCCIPGAMRDDTDFAMRLIIPTMFVLGLAAFAFAVFRSCFVPQFFRNADVIQHAEPRRMGTLPNSGGAKAPSNLPPNSKAVLSRKP